MHITDLARRLWPRVAQLLPEPLESTGSSRGGRPRIPDEEVFVRLVVFLRAGCSWAVFDELCKGSGISGQTCRRRLVEWRRAGIFEQLLGLLEAELCFAAGEVGYLDASFVRARTSGEQIGLTRHGKGCKVQVLAGADSLPRSLLVTRGGPSETATALEVVDAAATRPAAVIMDTAYDKNALHADLRERGIRSWAPRHPTHTGPSLRDDRLRPEYRQRWRVERFFAWLAAWRRVTTRWERSLANYRSWLCLATALIITRAGAAEF